MRQQMQVFEVDTGFDFIDQVKLQCIQAIDEFPEFAVFERVAPRDVGRVAVHICAGVNQKRSSPGRGLPGLVLVVHDRAVLVQRNDVAVR